MRAPRHPRFEGFAVLAALGLLIAPASADWEECRNDAILIVDASGSMASTDTSGNVSRIHRVRQAVATVAPQVAPFRNLGLMVYGGVTNGCQDIALRVRPGPDNAGRIVEALRDVLPNGRTPLTASVAKAAEILAFRARPASIVLLTDGEESCGGDPCGLARTLRQDGVSTRVHVVDYKLRYGSDWRGTFQSRCLADITGGRYVAVNTTAELVAALRETLGCTLVTEAQPDRPRR